jgi:hypothetical protein
MAQLIDIPTPDDVALRAHREIVLALAASVGSNGVQRFFSLVECCGLPPGVIGASEETLREFVGGYAGVTLCSLILRLRAAGYTFVEDIRGMASGRSACGSCVAALTRATAGSR